MSPEELEITIGKDGKVLVHMKGIRGGRCLEIAKWLESAIGRTEDLTATAARYETEGAVRVDVRQGESRG
ncbi:MAG: DUF2997 domain-containing protein [Planctomycetes bacterium]|nr:DUF2997 domain-containing protein [Planctomycetota bacterium]